MNFFKLIYLILIYFIIAISTSSCQSCSRTGRAQLLKKNEIKTNPNLKSSVSGENDSSGNKSIVKMEKVNGVYEIPVEINDVKMHFIFDTGASTISISDTEAMFLWKQGSLTKEDILGNANFSDANGDISEGTIINLKTVKIGNHTISNIKASIVHNLNAPLLFGESALEQFGKISIDYNKQEITFE